MRFRIRPVETSFYGFFTDAANNLVEGAEAAVRHPRGRGPTARRRRADAGRGARGDDATHAIFHQLNSSFITPFDREDIYSLASSLDDIMDFMEEAVDLVVLYSVEELPKGVEQQIEVLGRAARADRRGHAAPADHGEPPEYWIEVNRLENQADQIHRSCWPTSSTASTTLEVLKLKQIVDVLEEAADAFEHVANTVETIAVKES